MTWRQPANHAVEYCFPEKLLQTLIYKQLASPSSFLSWGLPVSEQRSVCTCVYPAPTKSPCCHAEWIPTRSQAWSSNHYFVLKTSYEYIHLFPFLPIPHQMKNCLQEINASSSTFYSLLIIFPEEICHPWDLSLLCRVNRIIEAVFLFYFKQQQKRNGREEAHVVISWLTHNQGDGKPSVKWVQDFSAHLHSMALPMSGHSGREHPRRNKSLTNRLYPHPFSKLWSSASGRKEEEGEAIRETCFKNTPSH